jgi:hypothetical protein
MQYITVIRSILYVRTPKSQNTLCHKQKNALNRIIRRQHGRCKACHRNVKKGPQGLILMHSKLSKDVFALKCYLLVNSPPELRKRIEELI